MLLVLFVLALMVIVAVNMNEYWQKTLLRSQHVQTQQHTRWGLLAAEALVRVRLQKALQEENVVHLGQEWLKAADNVTLEGVAARGMIRDRQNCFNLNALNPAKQAESEQQTEKISENSNTVTSNQDQVGKLSDKPKGGPKQDAEEKPPYPVQVFMQLLSNLAVDEKRAEKITAALRDEEEKDKDKNKDKNNSEKDQQKDKKTTAVDQESKPPVDIKSVTKPMLIETSELRAVEGMDAELYRQLSRLVCVQPNHELKININTLTSEQAVLFSALFIGHMSPDVASQFLARRPGQGWKGPEAVLELREAKELPVLPDLLKTVISVESHFFETLLWLEQDQNYYSLRSMLWRDKQSWQVLQRRYGIGE